MLASGTASASVFPNGAFSGDASGTTGAAFLRDPFGARAAAMGGAYAAAAQGAEALFQNPAALSGFEPASPSEVALGYDALLESAYQGAAAYARPLGADGALGAGVQYRSQGAQTIYDSLGNPSGSFTPLDFAAGAGYARRVGPVAVGGGLKLIRSKLNTVSGTSMAADFGVLGRHLGDLGDGPVDAGVSVSNLGPPLKLGSSADPLPFSARVGGLWHATPLLDAALDVAFPVDEDPYFSLGLEAHVNVSAPGSVRPWVASLRGGYDQNRGRKVDGFAGASFGAGLDGGAFRLDYAWIALGALGSANRVTLALRF